MRKVMLVAAAAAGLLAAGCGSSSHSGTSSNSGGAKAESSSLASSGGGMSKVRGETIGYLAPSLNISYWQWVYSGVQEQAKTYGMKTTEYNANNDPGQQLSNTHTAVTDGVKALAIGPVSSTSTPPVLAAAKSASVPISFAGIGPQPGLTDYTSSITANNLTTGKQEATFVCEHAKALGGNQVGMLSLPQDRENAQLYLKGAKQAFTQHGCDLVQILQTQGLTVTEAVQEANDLLTAHPNIKGIYGMYDEAGIGAAKALTTRHLVGKVALATADGSPTTVGLLKKGELQGLFLQEAVGQGKEAVVQDVNALTGKPVKKDIPLTEPLVTSRNLCSAASQKVLKLTYPASAGSYGDC